MRRYKKITGTQARKIWRKIYSNCCFTSRGSDWTWAEIRTEVRNVFIGTENNRHLLDEDAEIYITVGLE